MKKMLFFLSFLFVANAFAQEMDTTYAVTADGETVGLIHEKGMVPVVPEGMRLVDEVSFVEPEPAPVVVIENIEYVVPEMSHLYFETNKYDINEERATRLDNLAETMKDSHYLTVLLIGHADNVGTHQYNMILSQRRAASVKQALVERGIEESRISEKYVGMDNPTATNDTEEGRALNRCVEVIFSK